MGGVARAGYRSPVQGRYFDGGVQFRGGGPSDDHWRIYSGLAQGFYRGGHLFQRRSDQPGQADDVGLRAAGLAYDLVGRDHHAEVRHLITVAGHHDRNDVFSDVVHVSLDRGDEHFFALRRVFLFHKGRDGIHGAFHHAGAFHYLGEEHFSLSE